MNDFYTYAFLREDRTPYYIGKGIGNRIYSKKRRIHLPKDKSRIIFLKKNLTEKEAFKHEIYMIAVFGRKDNGTGILRNKTDGGEGPSGWIPSDETRKKWSEAKKGKNHPFYGKTKSEETKKRIGRGNKGKTHSEETKIKMSESAKVKIFSKEHRKNIGDATRKSYLNMTLEKKIEIAKKQSKAYSNKTSEQKSELAKKSSESAKGRKYWNNGITNILVRECPGGGWKLGRIASEKMKGRKWWNNGITNTITKECPGEGWKLGISITPENRKKISDIHKNKIVSEETRKKLSDANKGRTCSEEFRKKISESQKGKTHSEESKRKRSEKMKGKKWWNNGIVNIMVKECPGEGWKLGISITPENRKKISDIHKNKIVSEETRRKLSEAQKGNTKMLGKTHSEESKRKMSASSKGKKCWNDGCGNIKYMIECPGDDWRLGKK